jgi:predicted flavoprotein YhiN
LRIDLRPNLSREDLECALSAPRDKLSLSSFLRKKAKLSSVAISLLHEALILEALISEASFSRPEQAQSRRLSDLSTNALACLIKGVPVRLTSTAPIERAISTAGGVAFDELDERLMVRRRPGLFVAGEMLDWEAPTGGYLLQGCFASGAAAGRGALQWLGQREDS